MATENKVITVKAGDDKTINSYLQNGWIVKIVVAEHVATATSNIFSSEPERGKIIFVLEKNK